MAIDSKGKVSVAVNTGAAGAFTVSDACTAALATAANQQRLDAAAAAVVP